jgi:hypothetical protein
VRASAAPPPPLPHRSHARPPSPALAGALTELQQLTAADADARKSFVGHLAKNVAAAHALLQPLDEATPLRLRFNKGLALYDAQLRAVLALEEFKDVIMTGAQNAAAGAFARGRACARRRRVRASAAPPPPLPHRSHARPPSPALAGQASTDVNELKTCKLENPESFAQLEEMLLEVGVSAVRDGDSAALTGVTTANACDVQAAMDVVGAKPTGLTTRCAFARQGVRAPPPCAR